MTELERAVITWIAEKSDDPELKAQLRIATVSAREHTGVGCYSELAMASEARPTGADYGRRGPLTGPLLMSPALKYGGGTLLWFDRGIAKTLEIFTYDDPFPADHGALGEFTLQEGPP